MPCKQSPKNRKIWITNMQTPCNAGFPAKTSHKMHEVRGLTGSWFLAIVTWQDGGPGWRQLLRAPAQLSHLKCGAWEFSLPIWNFLCLDCYRKEWAGAVGLAFVSQNPDLGSGEWPG